MGPFSVAQAMQSGSSWSELKTILSDAKLHSNGGKRANFSIQTTAPVDGELRGVVSALAAQVLLTENIPT